MSELEPAVIAHLQAHEGLSELVGAKIYPLVIPQDATLPCITYQRVSGVRHSAMGQDTGLATVRLSFSCWATTYASAKAVAKQLRLALQRCASTIGSGDNIATGVASFIETDIDDYEPDTRYYRVILDFRISHDE